MLTLPEAASLFWPEGPLTVTSLRTAVRDGLLDVTCIARKLLTTKAAIRRMTVCDAAIVAKAPQKVPPAPPHPPDPDRERIRAMGRLRR